MSGLSRPLKDTLRDPVDPARLAAMWRNIQDRRQRSLRGPRGAALLLASAAAFVLAFVVTEQSEWGMSRPVVTPLPLRGVAPGPLLFADGTPLAALSAGASGLQVTLSDASRIELHSGARILPRKSSATLLALELVRGRVLFDVKPRGPRSWVIAAGAVEVQVLGTRFSVERLDAGVWVSVERGHVRVSGPGVPGGEQHLLAEQQLVVAREQASSLPPSAAATDAGQALGQAALVTPAPLLPAVAAPAPRPALPARSAFDQAVAARDYARAFASLGSAGYLRAVDAAQSVDALLLLADVARLSNHPREATRPLSRIAAGYGGDSRAALAALSLGRIWLSQLDSPAEAARALEAALGLGLPEGLAEDGFVRLVEAYAKAKRPDLARKAAERYRARFPRGRRRTEVNAWVGAP